VRQFALYYLDPVDRLVKEKFRIEHYTRYMDDMVLIHENKEYLQNCLKQIREQCKNELKLELNEKTQIFPIRRGLSRPAFLLDRQRQGNQKAQNHKTKSG